jgi:hypothetical protein
MTSDRPLSDGYNPVVHGPRSFGHLKQLLQEGIQSGPGRSFTRQVLKNDVRVITPFC